MIWLNKITVLNNLVFFLYKVSGFKYGKIKTNIWLIIKLKHLNNINYISVL